MSLSHNLRAAWVMYTPRERRNMAIYIAGIMFYKFGLEAFIGSILTLAQDRFTEAHTFTKVGALTGLNQAMQCVGSILIAPLIRRYPTRSVLASAIFAFGILTTILLIVDACTGGKIKKDGHTIYGRYDPDVLFPVYCATGVAYGMIELIRRVIPRDIVGGHVGKLKRMDAIVHVFYEIAGTAGAFASAGLITRLGNNYAFIVTPIFFFCAATVWQFISSPEHQHISESSVDSDNASTLGSVYRSYGIKGYLINVGYGFKNFGYAVWTGAFIVLSSRKFIWLVPGYSLALYAHRYLENGLAGIFAKRVLGQSSWQPIIVGGSNFGELLGAITVFFSANKIQTPIPFIRLDALTLNIVWLLPYYFPPRGDVSYAWRLAGIFMPISFAWAAGDVSLAAYIQSSLSRVESQTVDVSALGAAMAFLYVVYIVTNAILSSVLGNYVDNYFIEHGEVHGALRYVAGYQFSIFSVIMLISTLIPPGSLSLNPKLLAGENLNTEIEQIRSKTDSRSNVNDVRMSDRSSSTSGVDKEQDRTDTESDFVYDGSIQSHPHRRH